MWHFEGPSFVVHDVRLSVSPARAVERVSFEPTYGEPVYRAGDSASSIWTRTRYMACPRCHYAWVPVRGYTQCPHHGETGRWTGAGYGEMVQPWHLLVPYAPAKNEKGKPVVLLCRSFDAHVRVGLQGLFRTPENQEVYVRPDRQEGADPSEVQRLCLDAIWHEWLQPQYRLPSTALDVFVSGDAALLISQYPSWAERKKALAVLGYNIHADSTMDEVSCAVSALKMNHGIEPPTPEWTAQVEDVVSTYLAPLAYEIEAVAATVSIQEKAQNGGSETGPQTLLPDDVVTKEENLPRAERRRKKRRL